MLLNIEQIQAPIDKDIKEFESKFRNSMKSNVMLLDRIMTYIVKRKGKQIRPMFVFLTANMIGKSSEATHRGATLIELLHTATLVHDDVVDDANYRRGFFSINALWKNKIAVLVGDYLLSRGLLLSINNGDFELLRIVSKAVKEMSEGELLQIEKARNLDITEEIYYEIIRQKTASLIASCCGVGAASVSDSKEVIDKAVLFGEKVGLAFQIKDDLFDYSTSEMIGKPVGIDIKERKLTLPLIYTLNKASWWEKREMINVVKNYSNQPKKVQALIQKVKESGGIDYATKKMYELIAEAKSLLSEFPDNEYRRSLEGLVDFTINRSK
jgi:octaprenyl-diphosphate synthase